MSDSPACYRCNHPETLALSADVSRWSLGVLRYAESFAYANAPSARVAANYARACRLWEAVCGIRLAVAATYADAQVVASEGPIDGPWNVLAVSQLPPTGNYAGVLTQTFDQAEQLDDDLMVAMFAHELGHVLGIGHLAAGNLMAPVLDRAILTPQPGDIAEAQARYGPPPPTPTPTEVINVDPITFAVTVPGPGTYRVDFAAADGSSPLSVDFAAAVAGKCLVLLLPISAQRIS